MLKAIAAIFDMRSAKLFAPRGGYALERMESGVCDRWR
jgi:hypothetical protein